MLVAIVNTDSLDALRDRLLELGAPGLTVDGVMGIGKPLSQLRYSEVRGFVPKFFARSRVEVVVEDERVEELAGAIQEVCRTGKVGAGKIFVLPVERTIRIRSGEEGREALY